MFIMPFFDRATWCQIVKCPITHNDGSMNWCLNGHRNRTWCQNLCLLPT